MPTKDRDRENARQREYRRQTQGRSLKEMGIHADFSDKAHPNSLAASRDPEIQRKIKRGRLRADQELSAMKRWAASGFRSIFEEEETR